MKMDFKVAISAPFAAKPQQGKPRAKEPKLAEAPATWPSRIAVLMALAIRMDQLLRDGHVNDQANLARLAGVTCARMTQVMGLLRLAPDIQEALLFTHPTARKGSTPAERAIRPLLQVADWKGQRRLWTQIVGPEN